MNTNRQPDRADTAPGDERRWGTLTDNQESSTNPDSAAVSIVDTAGMRARYRAVARHVGVDPAPAVLAVAAEVPGPGLCAEIDRLARLLGQARRAYENLDGLAAQRPQLAGVPGRVRGPGPSQRPGAGLGSVRRRAGTVGTRR